MEESRKKMIKIDTIVVCLALATVVFIKHSKRGHRGLTSIPRGDVVWVKCSNPQCGAVYQMNKREFLEKVEERSAGGSPATAPLVTCKECQELSARWAVKCEKCGVVFFLWCEPQRFSGPLSRVRLQQTGKHAKTTNSSLRRSISEICVQAERTSRRKAYDSAKDPSTQSHL